MSDKFQVQAENRLLIFLISKLNGWSRSRIKQRLKSGCVLINGQSIVKHDYVLTVGDSIEVLASPASINSSSEQLEIIYSDNDLVVINKPAGLLSVASTKETRQHALAILRNQLSRPKRPLKLWPVHRLDRDTSGVLLFAKSHQIREAVMALWTAAEKYYLSIVEGLPIPAHGVIDQALRMDDKEYRMHVGAHAEAKRAVTHYNTQRTVNGRSLLELSLETGRQHQIRAHLAWLGHPVVGDSRYGTDGPRMGLHAYSLSITDPRTGKRLKFEASTPTDFIVLLKGDLSTGKV